MGTGDVQILECFTFAKYLFHRVRITDNGLNIHKRRCLTVFRKNLANTTSLNFLV
jgi:hypothetical protein